MRYNNIGANLSFKSADLDSNRLYYNFNLSYDYFTHKKNIFRHRVLTDGLMAKQVGSFYVGAGVNYELYMPSDSISADNEFIFAISPFLKKSTSQWNFKLGLELLRDRTGTFRAYPDINFGFTIVPSFINFFASLDGYLERNDPTKIIGVNPYLYNRYYYNPISNSTTYASALFALPDTDHELVITAGLKGSNGIGGKYLISASYSMIKNMLHYISVVRYNSGGLINPLPPEFGNYFMPSFYVGNILNVHGEISGKITNRVSFTGNANFYDYNIDDKPWNKPTFDAKFGLNYNLRDKILAGAELTTIGKRTNAIFTHLNYGGMFFGFDEIKEPVHFNLNLRAEYRYTKILSFWTKLNNVSFNDYYEWAFYPTYRFMFMAGFTYSL